MADVEFTFSGNAASLKAAPDDIKSELSRTKESVASLTSQFGKMYVGVQAAVAAIRTAWSALSNIPGQAARIEDLTTVFKGLMGSAEDAGELLQGLWQDAAHGAVALEDLAAAARPLTTVFSNTETIREWTRRFADIAAGSDIAASQLSKVYARIVTLGKVDSRAVESLAKHCFCQNALMRTRCSFRAKRRIRGVMPWSFSEKPCCPIFKLLLRME